MVESHQILRLRKQSKSEEYQILKGMNIIHIQIENLTNKNISIDLFGNNRKKIIYDEIKIKNLTGYYSDDDGNLTMLKNYINSVSYVEVYCFRIMTTDIENIKNDFIIHQKDEMGNERCEVIHPSFHIHPAQLQTNIVDIRKSVIVRYDTHFSFNISNNSSYNIMFFCGNNKGDVHTKVKSFYDEMDDEIRKDIVHYVPIMDSDKKRSLKILTLKQ